MQCVYAPLLEGVRQQRQESGAGGPVNGCAVCTRLHNVGRGDHRVPREFDPRGKFGVKVAEADALGEQRGQPLALELPVAKGA